MNERHSDPRSALHSAQSTKVRGYAHRVDIAADAQHVWRAVTESEHLARWCAPNAEIRARPGGLFRAAVDRVIELEAHIDIFDPGRRLRLIYLPTPELPPADSAMTIDFIIEATAAGTIVRLLCAGVPDAPEWDTQYRRLRVGWQQAMTRLKVFVERQSLL